MQIRDRIKRLERLPAKDLFPNPKNWRTHPQAQQDALRGILAEVGWADALLVRESDQGLVLIDGHLRAETTPDQLVPVLILDVDEHEADLLLASLDPLAAMATADAGKLQELLDDLHTNSPAVEEMFKELAEANGIFEVQEADMPEIPAGDRTTLSTMNFTLTQEQVAIVNAALKKAKQEPFIDTGNENSNGNALARIAEAYA